MRHDLTAGKQGFGLGLSFASAVAEWHGAHLELSDNEPGLRATLRFPGRPGLHHPSLCAQVPNENGVLREKVRQKQMRCRTPSQAAGIYSALSGLHSCLIKWRASEYLFACMLHKAASRCISGPVSRLRLRPGFLEPGFRKYLFLSG